MSNVAETGGTAQSSLTYVDIQMQKEAADKAAADKAAKEAAEKAAKEAAERAAQAAREAAERAAKEAADKAAKEAAERAAQAAKEAAERAAQAAKEAAERAAQAQREAAQRELAARIAAQQGVVVDVNKVVPQEPQPKTVVVQDTNTQPSPDQNNVVKNVDTNTNISTGGQVKTVVEDKSDTNTNKNPNEAQTVVVKGEASEEKKKKISEEKKKKIDAILDTNKNPNEAQTVVVKGEASEEKKKKISEEKKKKIDAILDNPDRPLGLVGISREDLYRVLANIEDSQLEAAIHRLYENYGRAMARQMARQAEQNKNNPPPADETPAETTTTPQQTADLTDTSLDDLPEHVQTALNQSVGKDGKANVNVDGIYGTEGKYEVTITQADGTVIHAALSPDQLKALGITPTQTQQRTAALAATGGGQARADLEKQYQREDQIAAIQAAFDEPSAETAAIILDQYLANPDGPEWAIKEAGGTLTVEQKLTLARIAGNTKYDVAAAQREYESTLTRVGVGVAQDNGRAITKEEMEKLKNENPALYDKIIADSTTDEWGRTVISQGVIDALKETDPKLAENLQAWGSGLKISSGVLIPKAELERIKKENLELGKLLETGGLDAYKVKLNDIQRAKVDEILRKFVKYEAETPDSIIDEYSKKLNVTPAELKRLVNLINSQPDSDELGKFKPEQITLIKEAAKPYYNIEKIIDDLRSGQLSREDAAMYFGDAALKQFDIVIADQKNAKDTLKSTYAYLGGGYDKNPENYSKGEIEYLLDKGVDMAMLVRAGVNSGILNNILENRMAQYEDKVVSKLPKILQDIYKMGKEDGDLSRYQRMLESYIASQERKAILAEKENKARVEAMIKEIEKTAQTEETNIQSTQARSWQAYDNYKEAEQALSDLFDKLDKEHPELPPEERYKGIEETEEYKNLQNSQTTLKENRDVMSDVFAEAFSFGKIPTLTFNKDQLAKQYETQLQVTLATFTGDKEKLKSLYEAGAFGKGEDALKAYQESLDSIETQDELEKAVAAGDLKKLERLKIDKNAFGGDEENYNKIVEYVKAGGRELSPINPDDIQAIKDSFGTKDQYIRAVAQAQPSGYELLKEVGISLIPIYGTIHNWDKMGGGWKAVSIVTDLLTLVPFVGGVAAAARVSAGVGRGARIVAGLKAIPRIFVSELKAPFVSMAHPVATAKATFSEVRNLAENIWSLRKIPLNSVVNVHGTVRLDVSIAGSPEAAMFIRDKLMELAAAGKKPVFTFAGKTYRLRKSAFMDGGLVAAGPDMRWSETKGGAVVQSKVYPEGHALAGQRMPEREQGFFTANTALERFTESSAYGLEKLGAGGIDEKLKSLRDSAKLAEDGGDLKLSKKLTKLADDFDNAKLSKDINKLNKAEADIVKELQDMALTDTLKQINDFEKQAADLYRIGNVEGAQEAMDQALALQDTLRKAKPGFAVFSPDVTAETITSGKLYTGMLFSPAPGQFWAIMGSAAKEDKAAKLLMQANDAERLGQTAEAAALTKEAKQLIKTGQSGFVRTKTAEIERKFPELFQLPELKSRYYTRTGGKKLYIFTDKPYDLGKALKSKIMAPIETIRNLYEPAISVKNIPMTNAQKMQQVEKLLKEASATSDMNQRAMLEMEADILRRSIKAPGSAKGAARAAKVADEADSMKLAAQEAEAAGDAANAEKLLDEAVNLEKGVTTTPMSMTAETADTAGDIATTEKMADQAADFVDTATDVTKAADEIADTGETVGDAAKVADNEAAEAERLVKEAEKEAEKIKIKVKADKELERYLKAAERAAAKGDIRGYEALLDEAREIAERIDGERKFVKAATERAGTVMGVAEAIRLIGKQPRTFDGRKINNKILNDIANRAPRLKQGAMRGQETRIEAARLLFEARKVLRDYQQRQSMSNLRTARQMATQRGDTRKVETRRGGDLTRAHGEARTPETPRAPEAVRTPETPRAPETTRTPDTNRIPETGRTPETNRIPETGRTPETNRIPETGRTPDGGRRTDRTTRQHHDGGHGGNNDDKDRARIKAAFAAITYKRGALGKGDDQGAVYHTWLKDTPKSEWERVITVGLKPDGAIYADGPGSATASMKRISGNERIDLREDTGAVDTLIRDSEIQDHPDIWFERDKNVKRGHEIYRQGNVSIREVPDVNKRMQARNKLQGGGKGPRGVSKGPRGVSKGPREINLGAGVFQESGTRGRRHIHLV